MRLFVTATAALVTLAATAQQPRQCVNPEVVNGLVFLGRIDLKVKFAPGLPAAMSGFRTPGGFSLIGTGVLESTETKVAYKTSMSSDRAYAALLAALGADGWAIESQPGSAVTFNVKGGLKDGTVCRNGERRNVLAVEFAGTSYLNIDIYPGSHQRECNTPDPGRMVFGRDAPRFQFPAGTVLAQGSGGGGGNSDMYTTSSRIISSDTATGLVEHLASQMMDQGWRRDSGWSGSRSAGSTWRKNNESGLVWGTIEIVRVSEGTYDVDFTTTQSR